MIWSHSIKLWWSPSVPCPSWGAIIHHIHSYPKSCDNVPVNMILSSTNKKQQLITNIMLLNELWSTATAVGKDVLGFNDSELGLHSICSELPCLCTWWAFLSSWSCWLVIGAAMPSCNTSESKFKNSAWKWYKQTAFSLYLRSCMRILESLDTTATLQQETIVAVTLSQILSILPVHCGCTNKHLFCTHLSNPYLSMAFCIPEVIYVFLAECFWGWDLEQIKNLFPKPTIRFPCLQLLADWHMYKNSEQQLLQLNCPL